MLLDLLIYVFYLSNGIVPDIKYQNYEIYLFIIVLVNDTILIGGLSMAFFESTNVMYKTQIGAAMCGIFYQLWFKILARTNKSSIFNTSDTLRDNTKFGRTDFVAKMYAKLKAKYLPLMCVTLFLIVIGFNVSFLRFLVDSTAINFNNPDFYVVPFLFKFWSTDTFSEYLVVMSLQIVFFCPEIVAYLSSIVYVCFILASLEVHVEEMAVIINHTFDTENYLSKDATMQRYNRNETIDLYRKVKRLIRYQQFLYRYVNDVIGMGKLIFNSMLSMVILSFILLVLSIQVAVDMLAKLKIVFVVITFMMVYFILCYLGETIRQMNHSIQSALYDAPWYSLTPHLRKYLFMLMNQTQSELHVKLVDMYTIDLDFYASTMKIVYSATNFILLHHKL
ncbi:uncharacterized protein LOC135836685 [Planococcus citri]|uniref:uncharacterized protein LOC135836685 n=1 Tax=Planococcus citri TaxID=170843 RepID=UPI0031F7F0C9